MILSRLSIRVRITLGTFLLAVAFFSGSAILVHRQVESVLDAASVAVLRSDASPYRVALRDEPGDALDTPGDDELIAVVDGAGTVQLNSLPRTLKAHFDDIDLTEDKAQTITAGSRSYLVLVTHEKTSTGTWSIIAARTEAASRLVLDSLTRDLIVGLVVLTLLFTLASWLLTSAALRPITRMRRSADELAGSGDAGLLPIPRTRDEVYELATTLNTLIGDLRESADREKRLVSDASHELRTPLAILQSQLELMRAGDTVTLDADVAAALAATHRMSDLVAELLELSRVEAMETSGTSTFAALSLELADAADRARFDARTRNVTVDFSTDGAGDLEYAIGAHDFGRLVDNLLTNAVKAQSTTVTAHLESDESVVRFTVDDDGQGLPDDFIPRAFDRFSQPDDGREGGTGLGLAIVAAIVAAASGTVSLRNTHSGARVAVTIPAIVMSIATTLIAVGALTLVAFAIVMGLRLDKPWLQPWAILRAVVQLGILSLVLAGIIRSPWLVASFLVLMVIAASWTTLRRLELSLRSLATVSGITAAASVVPVSVVFAVGAVEPSPRYALAIGGIVVGNVMTVSTLFGRALRQNLVARRDEVEGWLALGATPRRSALDSVRSAGTTALVPSTDQTRTTGIVTLPGAFVGSIFAGASPLAAAQFQLVVLASILCAGAVAVALMALWRGAPRVLPI